MGPAYSGSEVRTWFGRMIVDLAAMELPTGKMALLQEHAASQRAGVADKVVLEGDPLVALRVEGDLLENEVGQGIARDAADGFPFQASIGFDILRFERIDEGDSKTVNGREFNGPGLVVTKSALRETSIVALGADGSTETQVFAWGRGALALEEQTTMTPEAFAAANPAAVKAWKREGASDARAELGSMIEALPERKGFVAAQFAAGAGVEAIKVAAALSSEIAAANAEIAAGVEKSATELAKSQAKAATDLELAQAELAKSQAKVEQLKTQPGVGFSSSEDDDLATEEGDADVTQLTEQQARERFAKGSKAFQAEFGNRESAYLAYVRHKQRLAARG